MLATGPVLNRLHGSARLQIDFYDLIWNVLQHGLGSHFSSAGEDMSKQISVDERLFISREATTGKITLHETSEENTLEVHVFKTEPAISDITKGMTIKVGDSNNYAKCTVRRVKPCYSEELGKVEDELVNAVDSRLEKELNDLADLIQKSF